MRQVGPTHTALKEKTMNRIAKRDTYGIEDVGGAEVRRQVKAGDPIPPNIKVDEDDVIVRDGPEPVAPVAQVDGGQADADAVPYDQRSVEDLEAEVERRRADGREITVEGTGKGGNVVKDDLVAALEAADAQANA
jgi:hypothetical protein